MPKVLRDFIRGLSTKDAERMWKFIDDRDWDTEATIDALLKTYHPQVCYRLYAKYYVR